jgi:hypothetical protein
VAFIYKEAASKKHNKSGKGKDKHEDATSNSETQPISEADESIDGTWAVIIFGVLFASITGGFLAYQAGLCKKKDVPYTRVVDVSARHDD